MSIFLLGGISRHFNFILRDHDWVVAEEILKCKSQIKKIIIKICHIFKPLPIPFQSEWEDRKERGGSIVSKQTLLCNIFTTPNKHIDPPPQNQHAAGQKNNRGFLPETCSNEKRGTKKWVLMQTDITSFVSLSVAGFSSSVGHLPWWGLNFWSHDWSRNRYILTLR